MKHKQMSKTVYCRYSLSRLTRKSTAVIDVLFQADSNIGKKAHSSAFKVPEPVGKLQYKQEMKNIDSKYIIAAPGRAKILHTTFRLPSLC